MKSLHTLVLVLVVSCGPSPQIHSTGAIVSPQEFAFRNLTQVVVEAPSASFDWSEYHVHDGDAFHVPYSTLRVELATGAVVITDEGAGNGALVFDRVSHAGRRFRLNADGSVDVLAR
ncbi:MAG: hypothetical protein IPJ77_18580 [Planctomycetes bacterium]|nr:hypothetical protein [Planctomycetota bacterium]